MDTAQQVNGVSAEVMRVSLCLRDEEATAARRAWLMKALSPSCLTLKSDQVAFA